jgi:hypothetical protein
LRGAFTVLLYGCPQSEKIDALVSLVKEAAPDTKQPLPPASSSAVSGTEKWVALGFTDEAEGNFALESGKPFKLAVVGDKIHATTDVNVRKKAADWTTPIAIIKTGESAEIVELKQLKAGKLDQLWARIK